MIKFRIFAFENEIFFEDNYEDFIFSLESLICDEDNKRDKKIIISGAFPDCCRTALS